MSLAEPLLGLEPHLWTVRQTAAAVARRELSPIEAVQAVLQRIDTHDRSCRAFVCVRSEQALQQAREAERMTRSGAPLGVLHGVPVAIKDLFDSKHGWPNTMGSRSLQVKRASVDSLNVRRLQDAGAIVIGTTNTPELGHKCLTDNLLAGPTSTPFAPHLNAGGSSGGSAVAVACGMAAAATGSDGAGSLRVPASFCGVFTMKPTYGCMPAIGRPNGLRSAWPPAQHGVLTRSVADAAILLNLLAKPHPADPCGLPTAGEPFAGELDRDDVQNMRVGYCADWGGFPISAEVGRALEPAVEELERMGARVELVQDLHRIPTEDLSAVIRRAVGVMLGDLLDVRSEQDLDGRAVEPGVRELVQGVLALSALEVKRDERLCTTLYDRIQAALERYDVLVGPVAGVGAVPNATDGLTVGPSEIEGRPVDPMLGWCPTFLFNLTRHPAACVPAGATAEGVPVGLQIVAARHADRSLLEICAAVERNRPWADRYAEL